MITSVLPVGPWSAVGMLQTLATERISVGQGVPTQWAKLVELPALEGVDLSTLRVCATGAAPAPPDLVRAMLDRLGCPVVVRYACTEAPILAGTAPGDAPEVLLHTVGRPAEGVEIELVTSEGTAVEAGSVGTIRVRSAGAMRGDGTVDQPPRRGAGWIEPAIWGASRPTATWSSAAGPPRCTSGAVTTSTRRGAAGHRGAPAGRGVGRHRPDADVIGEIGVAFVAVRDEDPGIDADDVRAWSVTASPTTSCLIRWASE